MKTRCENPDSKHYRHYGGRGIKVCERWASFENFLVDMGKKPSRRHSIERDDVNGDYAPDNCRWATMDEQANNRRNNHPIEFRGKTQNMTQWARELGLSEDMVERRINLLGWSYEKALTTPHRGWGRGHSRKSFTGQS
jgi:hypothetical protein